MYSLISKPKISCKRTTAKSPKQTNQEIYAELIKANQELARAKRLSDIGFLASTVAHELRNPLAAITLAATNIKRKTRNPDLERSLNTIANKVAESDQLINNLLFYAKLRPPKLEKTNLHNIIEECIAFAEKQNKIKVTNKLAVIRDILIDADPLQMKEVFANLLNNAFDSVEGKSGKIEFSALLDQDFIRIYLKDNGVGINKDDLGRIFEPFFTTKSRGTGLGLTICSQIVELHGGQINIESVVNQGTTSIISLPRSA